MKRVVLLAVVALVALGAIVVFVIGRSQSTHQAILGDPPSAFTAQYGTPIKAPAINATLTGYFYGTCPDKPNTFQRMVYYAKNVVMLVGINDCGNALPNNWRDQLKTYLPADIIFSTAHPYKDRIQYVYTSKTLAETAPGALCGASDTHDGEALEMPSNGTYEVASVGCLANFI
jgi:hypothetical protein